MNKNIRHHAAELKKILTKAAHAYYVLDQPILEDAIYDQLYRDLIEIEKKDPSLITSDSPTQRIGGAPLSRFTSAKHNIPLLSLENALNTKELEAWISKTKKLINKQPLESEQKYGISFTCELKIDGNAVALSYRNGILVRGATRGDGEEGEDITSNIKTITSIPLLLNLDAPPEWVEVRGEAFISKERFSQINHERKNNNESLFANPRNACAGTLRQLDPKKVASRKLDFFAYSVHLPKNYIHSKNNLAPPDHQEAALLWLKTAGFKVNPHHQLISNTNEVIDYTKRWESSRHNLPYETDGVVVKVNEFNLQSKLGSTNRAPKWSIAFKYPPEEVSTKLIKLTCQVGRTGVITPVAEFEPVNLAKTIVSRATLHNAKRLKTLNLHKGDTIIVRKAGEIIPEVVKVINELRLLNAEPVELPDECPICKSQLISELNAAATRCINNSCPAIAQGNIRHWVSKGAMNIEGLGSKLIEQLVSRNIVFSIADLYKLNLDSLESLDRLGPKSATKLLNAIENSLDKPWHKQLYGLGIQHIGESNAKTIAKRFRSHTELSNTAKISPENFKDTFGIGDEIALSLKNWFTNDKNLKLLESLKEAGLSLEYKELDKTFNKDKKLVNKIFVLTGKLPSLERNDAKNLIESYGGKVTSSISSKTTFLVAGENSGNKLDKAKKLGVKIIYEDDLINLLS